MLGFLGRALLAGSNGRRRRCGRPPPYGNWAAQDATFVASTLIPADEVVFFEFLAVDDAAVLELAQRAELRCDRLVSAERNAP